MNNNIVVAARRRDGDWRGALIIDGNFQDALFDSDLHELINFALGEAIDSRVLLDGTEVGVQVTIKVPVARETAGE